MIDALADFQQEMDLLVGGVRLVQTGPPLLDALQGGSVRNPDACRPPQILNPFLLQRTHVAVELLEAAIVASRGMNGGVQARRDGLQSHLVKRQFDQSVYRGGGGEEKRKNDVIPFASSRFTAPDFGGSSLTNLRLTDVRNGVQKRLDFLTLKQNLPERCERRADSLQELQAAVLLSPTPQSLLHKSLNRFRKRLGPPPAQLLHPIGEPFLLTHQAAESLTDRRQPVYNLVGQPLRARDVRAHVWRRGFLLFLYAADRQGVELQQGGRKQRGRPGRRQPDSILDPRHSVRRRGHLGASVLQVKV